MSDPLGNTYGQNLSLRTGKAYWTPDGGAETFLGNVKLLTFVPEKERHPVTDGSDNQDVDVLEFIKCRVCKITLDKFRYYSLKFAYGIDPTDESAGVSSEVTDEIVSMDDAHTDATGWHALTYGQGAQAPCSAVVCYQSAGKTGTQYIEGTDFYFDYFNGTAARIAAGSISDGQDVYFSYKYTTQDAKVFTFVAGDPINSKGAFRYVHDLMDNTNTFTIQIPLCYVAEDPEITHNVDTPGEFTVTLRSLKDESQATPGHGTSKFTTS